MVMFACACCLPVTFFALFVCLCLLHDRSADYKQKSLTILSGFFPGVTLYCLFKNLYALRFVIPLSWKKN